MAAPDEILDEVAAGLEGVLSEAEAILAKLKSGSRAH